MNVGIKGTNYSLTCVHANVRHDTPRQSPDIMASASLTASMANLDCRIGISLFGHPRCQTTLWSFTETNPWRATCQLAGDEV